MTKHAYNCLNMASPPFRGGQGGQHLDSQSSNTAQPNSISGRPQAAQLEFSQAMTDFKVMFPDMDAEVIEAVLRANNGAVDATIDHLLTMSADNEAEKVMHDQIDGAIPKKGKIEHPPDYVGVADLAAVVPVTKCGMDRISRYLHRNSGCYLYYKNMMLKSLQPKL